MASSEPRLMTVLGCQTPKPAQYLPHAARGIVALWHCGIVACGCTGEDCARLTCGSPFRSRSTGPSGRNHRPLRTPHTHPEAPLYPT